MTQLFIVDDEKKRLKSARGNVFCFSLNLQGVPKKMYLIHCCNVTSDTSLGHPVFVVANAVCQQLNRYWIGFVEDYSTQVFQF